MNINKEKEEDYIVIDEWLSYANTKSAIMHHLDIANEKWKPIIAIIGYYWIKIKISPNDNAEELVNIYDEKFTGVVNRLKEKEEDYIVIDEWLSYANTKSAIMHHLDIANEKWKPIIAIIGYYWIKIKISPNDNAEELVNIYDEKFTGVVNRLKEKEEEIKKINKIKESILNDN